MYSMKKLMVKNIIQQNEWVSQLSLRNSKISNLMKKLLDTKSKELKVKVWIRKLWNWQNIFITFWR